MFGPHKQKLKGKKLGAALIVAFILCNAICIMPAFASTNGQQVSDEGSSPSFCIPIPIIHPCKPTPTPSPTPSPTATPSPTPTPSPTATPSPGPTKTPTPSPTKTPTPGPTKTPTPGPTANPSPTPTPTPGPVIHLSSSSSFTLKAKQIVGTNAHLSLLPDPSHPILTFSAVTIDGLTLTHLAFSLSASGPVTGSGVAIKTSVFQDFLTALGSFANKADLLTLILGGTVPRLVMNNVTLQVDDYIRMQSNSIVGFKLEQN